MNSQQQKLELIRACDVISRLISSLPWYLEPEAPEVERSLIAPKEGKTFSRIISDIVRDMVQQDRAVVEVATGGSCLFELLTFDARHLGLAPAWHPESAKDSCRWVYQHPEGNAEFKDQEIGLFPIDGNFEITHPQLLGSHFYNRMQARYSSLEDLLNLLEPFAGEDEVVLQRLIDFETKLKPSTVAIAQIIGRGINRILSKLEIASTLNFGFRNEVEFALWHQRHEKAQLEMIKTRLLLGELGYF